MHAPFYSLRNSNKIQIQFWLSTQWVVGGWLLVGKCLRSTACPSKQDKIFWRLWIRLIGRGCFKAFLGPFFFFGKTLSSTRLFLGTILRRRQHLGHGYHNRSHGGQLEDWVVPKGLQVAIVAYRLLEYLGMFHVEFLCVWGHVSRRVPMCVCV